MSTVFQGFPVPTSNYFKMPNEIVNIIAHITSIAELKVILYVIRHTWGFQEYGVSKVISVDEFMHGRRRQDNTRMDEGTGLSNRSVIDGLKLAEEHGYLICKVDTSDLARIKKFYALRMLDRGEESSPPEEVSSGEKGSASYEESSLSYETSSYPGEESSHRSEKDTSRKTPEKDTNERHLIGQTPSTPSQESSSKQESESSNSVATTSNKKESASAAPRKPVKPRATRQYVPPPPPVYTLEENMILEAWNALLEVPEDRDSHKVHEAIASLDRKLRESKGVDVSIFPDVYKKLDEEPYWNNNISLGGFVSQFSRIVQKLKKPTKSVAPQNTAKPSAKPDYHEAASQHIITPEKLVTASQGHTDGVVPDSHKGRMGIEDCPPELDPELWFGRAYGAPYRQQYYDKLKRQQGGQQPL